LESLIPKDMRPLSLLGPSGNPCIAPGGETGLNTARIRSFPPGLYFLQRRDATNRLEAYPMSKVDGAVMWRTGETARKGNIEVAIEPSTAGIYLGIMMAQIDVLQQNGHGWSEICNETTGRHVRVQRVDRLDG